MTSPIGLYLVEFRPGGFTPGFADDASVAMAVDLLFEAGAGRMPAPAHAVAEPEDSFEPEMAAEVSPEIPDDPLPDPLHEAAIATLEAEHAAELDRARQHWADTEGATLAALITERFADLERSIADTLAPLLEPFLAKAAQLKAVDELRAALATLLARDDGEPITVTGPEDLIAAIERHYAGHPVVAFQTADAPDVSIRAGETRIQSQLRLWACTLDAALGAEA